MSDVMQALILARRATERRGLGRLKKTASAPDNLIFFLTVVLLVLGWVTLYSASALVAENRYGDQYFFLKKQIMWSAIGMVGLVLSTRVNLRFIQKNARFILGGVLVSLVLVLILGHEVGGARRWLRIAGIGFQPSEFAKLGLVIALADYLDRKQSKLKEFWTGFMPPMAMLGAVVFLIALEPDLGTPMLIVLVGVGLIYLAGARLGHLFLLFLAGLPVLYYEVFHVAYRRQRILAFLDPWRDTQGAAYQLIQSFLALGSGGFWGKGPGESVIKMYYLPESQTDFIFSILGEEWGFIGTATLTAIFFLLAFRGFGIATRAANWFETLLAAGVSLLLGGQAAINLCVVTGLFPTKGIPLPFISFGGSSLVLTLISVGLLLNVSRRAHNPSLLTQKRRRGRP